MDSMLREAFLKAAIKSRISPVVEDSTFPLEEHWTRLNTFIDDYKLNQKNGYSAAHALRDCEPRVQRAIMQVGGLENARNPSAIVMARIRNESPSFTLPVKGTGIYVLHMRPLRAAGTNLDVKCSSFRTLGRFFECLEDEGLLVLKPHESDPVITSIDWNHPELQALLPKHMRTNEAGPDTKCEEQHGAADDLRDTKFEDEAIANINCELKSKSSALRLNGEVLERFTDPQSKRIWFWHSAADRAMYEDALPEHGWTKFRDENGSRFWWWNEQTDEFFFDSSPCN